MGKRVIEELEHTMRVKVWAGRTLKGASCYALVKTLDEENCNTYKYAEILERALKGVRRPRSVECFAVIWTMEDGHKYCQENLQWEMRFK